MTTHTGRPEVLGLGLACLDYVFRSDWAERGGQARVRDHAVSGGGLIGTAVVAAARLGAETAIWTWVGDDDEGRQVIAGLREEGVDTNAVEILPHARTAVSFVHVEEETGERTIYHRPGLEVPSERAQAVGSRQLSCDVLLVDAVWPEASIIAARRAREAGIPVVGDFCPTDAADPLAGYTSHLIVPGACAERIAPGASRGEQLRRLMDVCVAGDELLPYGAGPEFVCITAGPEGCHYLDGASAAHQPAFPVEVVDTTGAGDVFHGAFGYALACRWPIPRCVEFASAVAALSCRALGGRAGIPNLAGACRVLGWEA